MFKTCCFSLAFVAALLGSNATVHAATLKFTTFGPRGTFDTTLHDADVIRGPVPFYAFAVASSFTVPSFGFFLDHIDVALSDNSCDYAGNNPRGAAVDLVGDKNGVPNTSGPVIAHWLVTKLPSCAASFKPVKLKSANGSIEIPGGGSKYWIVITPVGLDDGLLWWLGLPFSRAGSGSGDGGNTWFSGAEGVGAFDVWAR